MLMQLLLRPASRYFGPMTHQYHEYGWVMMAIENYGDLAYLWALNNGPNQAARSTIFSVVGIDLGVELVRGGELVLVPDGSGTSHMHALPFSKAESPFFCHLPISAPGGGKVGAPYAPHGSRNPYFFRLDSDTWAIRHLCVHLNLVDDPPTHPTKTVIT